MWSGTLSRFAFSLPMAENTYSSIVFRQADELNWDAPKFDSRELLRVMVDLLPVPDRVRAVSENVRAVPENVRAVSEPDA
jgi:hypothetical protein